MVHKLPISIKISQEYPESFSGFQDLIKNDYSKIDQKNIERAFEVCKKSHEGQIRRSGEPYVIHPLGVASILRDLHMDAPSIITGFLHDTVEDTDMSLEQIEKDFGKEIRDMVDGMTKLSKIHFHHSHEFQGENMRKMMFAMVQDVRVIIVKLADRLHNIRTLNHMPFDKQQRIAQETLDVYAPLAGRLGISSIKIELEDLCFRYLNPEQYYDLVQKLNRQRQEREKYVENVCNLLSKQIEKESQVKFQIQGRPKHLYSIYSKIQRQNISFYQINDLMAFRICVDSVPECYEILGIVHSLWKPVPGRFKDFIALPKTNNYQSLHTTVIGPKGEPVEIQIRTYEMHQVAEWGIAAHWQYKEYKKSKKRSEAETEKIIEQFKWLRDLVNSYQKDTSSDEFLENVKTDLMEFEVYVFTPQGEVKAFPEGATPIDFAYAIHTDLGSQVVSARVNGKVVPLKYKLQNGDMVEVVTSKNQTPSRDWLRFVATSRAKSKIRSFIKAEESRAAIEIGKNLLHKELKSQQLPVKTFLSGPEFEKFLRSQGLSGGLEDLYAKVGYGHIVPETVIKQIGGASKEEAVESSLLAKTRLQTEASKESSKTSEPFHSKDSLGVEIDGVSNLLTRFASCCQPIPGDPIVGFITRGRGLTIHRADCPRVFELAPERKTYVHWQGVQSSKKFPVSIEVTCEDSPGLLGKFTEVFTRYKLNIGSVKALSDENYAAKCVFNIFVTDTSQLLALMTELKKVKGVINVQRLSQV